jgi:uncharacterized protein with PIN domain
MPQRRPLDDGAVQKAARLSPDAAPRLLLDEMLAALARWLRAAGYDAALARPSAPDRDLIGQARAEDRVLVTRDRTLASEARGVQALLLPDASLDDQAAALARALRLDWRLAPFTRCMMDNTPLRPATAEEIAAMPQTSRDRPGPFRACPRCGRLFWPGSHVRRMAERLERWATAPTPRHPP